MRKFGIIFLLLVAVILNACTPNAATNEVIPEASVTMEEQEPTEEAAPAVTEETAADTTTFEASGPAECRPFSLVDNILPEPEPNLPDIRDTDWVQGPEDALVTIIEYSEFQCPYCALYEPALDQLYENFPDDVRLVFRHFPLSIHDKAQLASQIAEAVGAQDYDSFFKIKKILFEERDQWVELTAEEFTDWAAAKVEDLGLDKAQFLEDINDEETIARIQQSYDEGIAAGVTGTPYIFINGSAYEGQRSYDIFAAIVELFKFKGDQFTECPPQVIDPDKNYKATLHTEKGDIVIDLLAKQAPVTVNSFVYLAEEGWFDNVTFHRVIPGFVAQAGDPLGQGYGGPGYAFDNEVTPELLFDGPGVVGMANSGEDINGSQFFITYDALPDLNGGYTIFGEVTEGMDVAESLTERDASTGEVLPDGDKILSVSIEEY